MEFFHDSRQCRIQGVPKWLTILKIGHEGQLVLLLFPIRLESSCDNKGEENVDAEIGKKTLKICISVKNSNLLICHTVFHSTE
jgi:hypothetical protein